MFRTMAYDCLLSYYRSFGPKSKAPANKAEAAAAQRTRASAARLISLKRNKYSGGVS